jgi:hypothetical protein
MVFAPKTKGKLKEGRGGVGRARRKNDLPQRHQEHGGWRWNWTEVHSGFFSVTPCLSGDLIYLCPPSPSVCVIDAYESGEPIFKALRHGHLELPERFLLTISGQKSPFFQICTLDELRASLNTPTRGHCVDPNSFGRQLPGHILSQAKHPGLRGRIMRTPKKPSTGQRGN